MSFTQSTAVHKERPAAVNSPAPTLADLARKALEDAGGNVVEASALLEDMARKNMKIWKSITESLLSTACYSVVSAQVRQMRSVIWNAPNYDKGGNGARVVTHGAGLLDIPLPGGMKLRDATGQEVLAAADFYQRQASQMTIMANWLAKIAQKVGRRTKPVGALFTEEDLQQLKDEVTQ